MKELPKKENLEWSEKAKQLELWLTNASKMETQTKTNSI